MRLCSLRNDLQALAPHHLMGSTNELDLDKLEELIVLLARHRSVHNLGVTKLAKLVYYIDAEAMRELDQSVTQSEFIKHEQGPVPSRMDRALKQLSRAQAIRVAAQEFFAHGMTKVEAMRDADLSRFSAEELAVIERVAKRLGRMSATDLADLSYKEPAWREAEYLGKLDAELIPYGTEEDPDGL